MSQYVRLTRGLYDKGVLVKPEDVDKHIKNRNLDHYTSIHYYNNKHYEEFQREGSIKGIEDLQTNKLVFDLDCKKDLNKAKYDALIIISRLEQQQIKKSQIEIYFSGQKGFTLVVNLDKYITPSQMANAALKLGRDLKTLDASLYNPSRILRIPNTKHQESGLYKIQISYDQLKDLSIDQIKTLATTPKENKMTDKISLSEELFKEDIKPEKEEPSATYNDELEKPPHWKNCKWSLLQGNFKAGERHNAMTVLAATLRAMPFGYDYDTTYNICIAALKKSWKKNEEGGFDESELEKVLDSVYSETWKGGTGTCRSGAKPGINTWLREYCLSLGEHSCENDDKGKEELGSPLRIQDVYDDFKDFMKNFDKNTIKTGIEEIDREIPMTIGLNLGIVGAASSGKTALALEILKNTSKAGIISVFASLDMHRNRLLEKLVYKITDQSRKEVLSMYNEDRDEYVKNRIKEDYANVYFYDRSSPSVEDIRNYIKNIETETGKEVKLVMLDYFERVNSDISDDTSASKDVAGGLQDLINDFNICLITLVQPNKISLHGGPDTPILNYTAIKGSSFLYQSFRAIISIWRPFFNPETKDKDKYLEMAIIKNDLGELGKFVFGWKGRTGDISQLDSVELLQYKQWMQEKDEKKIMDAQKSGQPWS